MIRTLLSIASLGRLAHLVARVSGWSPMARRISISGAEGPEARCLQGMIASVRSVDGSVMVVAPDPATGPDWSAASRLRLTARHRGWTPFSLLASPIAVVVERDESDERWRPIAIATAALMRP